MDTTPLKEIVNELLSSLETLEAQSSAALEFLKAEKRGADKKLAPFLEQAAEASNVRYRAARLRMERLFSELERNEEKAAAQKKEPVPAAQPQQKQNDAADGSEKPSDAGQKKIATAHPDTAEEAAQKPSSAETHAEQSDEKPKPEAKPSTPSAKQSDQPKKDAA